MQITIDIDPEKIDYEKITDQIVEQLKDAPIEDIITSSQVIEHTIRDLFWQRISEKFDKYIKNNMKLLDDNGFVTKVFENRVNEFLNKKLEELFKEKIETAVNGIDQDSVNEAIAKIAPSLLLSSMIEWMKGYYFNAEEQLRDKAFEDAKGAIRYSFKANGMPVSTPYGKDGLPQTDY